MPGAMGTMAVAEGLVAMAGCSNPSTYRSRDTLAQHTAETRPRLNTVSA